MKMSEITSEIDHYITDNPPHRYADARMLQICMNEMATPITDNFRNGDAGAFIASCRNAIDVGVRSRMIRSRMQHRNISFADWHKNFIAQLNRELSGENVVWQKLPWDTDNAK